MYILKTFIIIVEIKLRQFLAITVTTYVFKKMHSNRQKLEHLLVFASWCIKAFFDAQITRIRI